MLLPPSLPADATLLQVFRAVPDKARPLLDCHQVLLRGSLQAGRTFSRLP